MGVISCSRWQPPPCPAGIDLVCPPGKFCSIIDNATKEWGCTDLPDGCGDKVPDYTDGEACDDGNFDNTDDCLDTCQEASCGDGFLHRTGAEECDDGNANDGDFCNNECKAATCDDGVKNAH